MKSLITIATILLITACGSSKSTPAALVSTGSTTASPVATPVPVAAAVTQTFSYGQEAQICAALKVWNPLQTNIQFPGDPANMAIYTFTNAQITQNAVVMNNLSLYVALNGTTVCIVYITGGKIVSIQ